MPRHQKTPEPKLKIWKQDGKLYYVEPSDLRAVIAKEGVPEAEQRRHMGFSFHYIQDLLDGKRIDIWGVQLVEHGILKHEPIYVPSLHEMWVNEHVKKTKPQGG